MLNIIFTEFLKLKRSKVLLLLPLGALLPPLLNFFVYLKDTGKHVVVWSSYFEFTGILINVFMAIALFALLAGYLCSREFGENTINTVFTYPISRMKFILAKTFVMYILIIVVLTTSYIFTVALGLLLPHEALDVNCLIQYAVLFCYMALMHLALSPIAMLLAMIGKSIIPPVALGITGVFINVVVVSSEYGKYFPWSLPGVLSVTSEALNRSERLLGIEILIATFVIGIAGSMIYIVKNDVISK